MVGLVVVAVVVVVEVVVATAMGWRWVVRGGGSNGKRIPDLCGRPQRIGRREGMSAALEVMAVMVVMTVARPHT